MTLMSNCTESEKLPDRLCVIASGGSIPRLVAQRAQEQGIEVYVVKIMPFCDDNFDEFNSVDHSVGALSSIYRYIRSNKITSVVIVGSAYRPSVSEFIGSPLNIFNAIRVWTTLAQGGGDDSLLRRLVRLFERQGFTVIAPDTIAPELLAPSGLIAGNKPSKENFADIDFGFQVIDTLSRFDIGQGIVVHNGHILAVEAAEGTDEMIRRVGQLRNTQRKNTKGILVKGVKSEQDLRIDRPTIGVNTIKELELAGCSGIAVEAGGVNIGQISKVKEYAERAGIFVYGVQRKGR